MMAQYAAYGGPFVPMGNCFSVFSVEGFAESMILHVSY